MTITLRDVMTPSPHTIGDEQPLSRAHEIMRQHGIRHLPVLNGGRLAGLLSLRDLHLVETLRDVDPATVEVSEAMSAVPFAVEADTPLLGVAEEMAKMKFGSAVALSRGKVVGVFTTVDAMRLLSTFLREDSRPARTTTKQTKRRTRPAAPSATRSRSAGRSKPRKRIGKSR